MTNSISVRIKRTALGLGAPSQSVNEVAAFMARGEVGGRRFHYQIVAAALQNPNDPNETPWDHMLKMVPDIDQLDLLRSQHDPEYITIVFRGVAEMAGNCNRDEPDNWLNWIGLENDREPHSRASANLDPSPKDKALWKAMDKVAIDWANQLAPDHKDIQWQSKKGDERWTDVPLDSESPEILQYHDPIGSSHHEGGTLFMGDKDNKDKSITDTDGKFHDLNIYVVGPAVFPTIGDANPSLTGLTLARRTADAILGARATS
jgi:choline dehydrogenase-like flavoprotein